MDKKIMEYRIQNWIPVIQAQVDSGLTISKWCKLNNISRTTFSFSRWNIKVRQYLMDMQASEEVSSEFVEILPSAQVSPDTSPSEIFCGFSGGSLAINAGGYNIVVNSHTTKTMLVMALRAIKEC